MTDQNNLLHRVVPPRKHATAQNISNDIDSPSHIKTLRSRNLAAHRGGTFGFRRYHDSRQAFDIAVAKTED
jgi:hypothetical protein